MQAVSMEMYGKYTKINEFKNANAQPIYSNFSFPS
jgi:hypothetical protein